MKTLKIFSTLTLGLLLTGSFSAFTQSLDGEKTLDDGTILDEGAPPVTFIVTVDNDVKVEEGTLYLINVFNDDGNPVDHPQVFVNGVSKYLFTEWGEAAGDLRLATMTVYKETKSQNSYVFIPSKLPGPFVSGEVYHFNTLIPVKKIDEGNDPSQNDLSAER